MESSQRIRWWQWPNVLALDAALVGVGWLWLIGSYTVDYAWGTYSMTGKVQLAVMGLSIWLVYFADRWLDVRKLDETAIPTLRHHFMKRYGNAMIPAWIFLFVFTFLLAMLGLPFIELEEGLGLLMLCVLHGWLVQKKYFRLPLKEAVIGLAFASGVYVFLGNESLVLSVAPVVVLTNDELLLAAGLFGSLCFANCALIAERERDIDRALGRASVARQFPHLQLIWAGLALAVGGSACWLLPAGVVGIKAALVVTGAFLGLLGVLMNRLPPEVFRVLADTAMLTPWVVMGWQVASGM